MPRPPEPPPVTTPPGALPTDVFTGGARKASQRAPQVRKRPRVRATKKLPGYMNDNRVAEQWDGPETTGSQYGHTNDGAHAWAWI